MRISKQKAEEWLEKNFPQEKLKIHASKYHAGQQWWFTFSTEYLNKQGEFAILLQKQENSADFIFLKIPFSFFSENKEKFGKRENEEKFDLLISGKKESWLIHKKNEIEISFAEFEQKKATAKSNQATKTINYQWTKWFSELAQKIKDGGEGYLHHKVFNEINWGDNTTIRNYKVTDPLSFFYFLAFKSGNKDRDTVYSSVHELFAITAELPDTKNNENFIFPKDKSDRRTIFTNSALVDKDLEELKRQAGLCWKLFNQAVAGKLEAEDFSRVLDMKGLGVCSLTQTLFLINPTKFCPIDETGPLAIADYCGLPNFNNAEIQIKNDGLPAYLKILDQIKIKFIGCEFYEINTLAHLIGRGLEGKAGGIEVSDKYWQVSTNAYNNGQDYWSEFSENYHVRAYGEKVYPTKNVEVGDIILVRTRAEKTRAIGIAYGKARNDSKFGDNWDIIDILWIIKQDQTMKNISNTAGFTRALGIAKNFKTVYPETFKILENLANKNSNTENKMNDPKKIYKGELNQIFYGPPGTGKTYNTIAKAVEIADPNFYKNNEKNRTELKERFAELKKDGQIAFVTFHQSFSYEDFIEGIKPQLDANGQISYKVKDGIFKQICEDASENYKDSKLNPQIFTKKLEIEDILEKFADYIEEENENKKPHYLPTPNSDSEDSGVTLDKILKNKSGNFQSFELGGSVASQSLVKNIFLRDLQNYLDKKITTYEEIKPTFKSKRKYHGNARYYWGAFKLIEKAIDDKKIDGSEEKEQIEINKPELKNFVLIIDEINRGNISKIFGELITLLETDKRIGNPEALTLKLPYSASFGGDDVEEFGVPNNLYIIGTMNTADRSLSLLDTALRRRFRFIEKIPDYTLLDGIKIAGIEIGEMLKSINERIVEEYDREHQIGHSFFLKLDENSTIEDLSEIFAYKILPLLEEYFYEDREKIDQVLNKNGFYKKENGSWELDQDALKKPDCYIKIYSTKDKKQGEADNS